MRDMKEPSHCSGKSREHSPQCGGLSQIYTHMAGGGDHYPLLHLLKLNDMQSDIHPAASVVKLFSYSPEGNG